MALDRESRRGFVVSVAVYALAAGVVLFTGSQRHPQVVVIAAGLLLVAAAVADLTVRRVRERHQLPLWQRTIVPLLLTVVALALAVMFLRKGATDGFGLFCVVGAYITMGHLVGEMRSWSRVRLPLGIGLLLAVTTVVGWGLWVGQSDPTGLYVALGALLLAPIGLTLVSAAVLRTGVVRPVGYFLVGAAVLAAGAFWLGHSGVDAYFVVIGVVLLLVLVLAITADTQMDVVLVATLVALVWSVFPRAVPLSADVVPAPVSAGSVSPGDRVLVSLGDSYMSGEGAQKFYTGTNSPGGARPNECRRSPTAYAHLVLEDPASKEFAPRLAFFACSGAVATDLWKQPQFAGEPPGGHPSTQLQQLSALRRSGARVPLVLVSIGGNDANFSDIAIACVAPGNCVQRGEQWLQQLQRVAQHLNTAYDEIRAAVGADVPVLVVPYPQPINENRGHCGYSMLEPQEHRFLHGFVGQLDGVVRQAAREHGFYYLADMEGALAAARMRICDNGSNQGRLGVNFIAISDTDGLIDQLANPFGWLHNSLHPNERGHQQMTRVLAAWMRARPRPRGLADEPGSDVYTVASLQDVMGPTYAASYCGEPGFETQRCALSDLDWTVTEVARFVRGILAPGFVMALGAWLASLALLAGFHPWTRRASGWLSRHLFGFLGRLRLRFG